MKLVTNGRSVKKGISGREKNRFDDGCCCGGVTVAL